MLQVLAPYARDININDKVMALYLDHLLPGITQQGADNNYGSSAMYDVLALQVWLLLFPHLPPSCQTSRKGPHRSVACFAGRHGGACLTETRHTAIKHELVPCQCLVEMCRVGAMHA